jgi:ribonuclease H2 subunit A
MDDPTDSQLDSQALAQETPAENVFIAPSITTPLILSGESYTYHSPIPATIKNDTSTECVLGVDEAGRGPVLGPMVYGLYYLPLSMHRSLLADTYRFDDSKVLSPAVRSDLMEKICTPGTELYGNCGWATRTMSARDIGAAQLGMSAINLNVQAMDATIDLIREVLDSGVNIREIYIDTIGPPATYQKKLEKIFPTQQITVAKKADSLYPCVSAASVCAKVTRDAALEVLYTSYSSASEQASWGSGYPSDARCTTWMRRNMDPVFGWGSECRFSWGTAKEMLEAKDAAAKVAWPDGGDEDDSNMKMTAFMSSHEEEAKGDELGDWFGRRVAEEVF